MKLFGMRARELEETEYFIPAVYMAQGILMSALPLLASMDKPLSFTRNLSYEGGVWFENFFYLPLLAGFLFVSASFLRNSGRNIAGALALQGALAGSWFGVITLLGLRSVMRLNYPAAQRSGADSGAFLSDAVVLAFFFFPLLFVFLYAVRDLLPIESFSIVVMRLMAGCCGMAALRMFRWRDTRVSVGGTVILICWCLAYALVALHQHSILGYAARLGTAWSSVTALAAGVLCITPDFSGLSFVTWARSDLLLIFLADVCLLIASAQVLSSHSSARTRI